MVIKKFFFKLLSYLKLIPYVLSSGRVHKAVVTQLEPESESVTVEWFENDETKGKEVNFYSESVYVCFYQEMFIL